MSTAGNKRDFSSDVFYTPPHKSQIIVLCRCKGSKTVPVGGTALVLTSYIRLGLGRLIDAYACVISELSPNLNHGNDLELVDRYAI